MNLPRERLRFTTTRGSERRAKGWLVVSLRGMDLDGVNELVISMDDVEAAAARGGADAEALARARNLLGG